MKKIRLFVGLLILISMVAVLPQGARAAKKLITIKGTMANPIFNPGISFLWIGNFLGYYQEEGVDAQFVAAQGGAQALGWVVTGRTHLGFPRPIPVLFRTARGQDMGIIGVYNMNRDPIYGEGVAVPVDSPIKSVCDLQGKKIGVMSATDSGPVFVKRALQECGIEKPFATFLPTGVASKSALAMRMGRIDAWSSVDVQYTLAKAAGFKFRMIPFQDWTEDLFGNVVWVNRKYLKKNRKAVVGWLRSLAKSSVFFYTNPEAALDIHYVLYPESLPKGMTKAQAKAKFIKVLNSRKDKLKVDDEKIKKFGAFDDGEWKAYVKFIGLDKKLPMSKVKTLYTNDLIDEVNDFDIKAVEERARNFDFKKELKAFRAREKR